MAPTASNCALRWKTSDRVPEVVAVHNMLFRFAHQIIIEYMRKLSHSLSQSLYIIRVTVRVLQTVLSLAQLSPSGTASDTHR